LYIVLLFRYFSPSCNITGSVICNNALINENSTVKDCQVGESHTIPEGCKYNNVYIQGPRLTF
jgi:ADP-glucose pyrophosphorylase